MLISWWTLGIFIVVEVGLAYACWRFRDRAGRAHPEAGARPHRARGRLDHRLRGDPARLRDPDHPSDLQDPGGPRGHRAAGGGLRQAVVVGVPLPAAQDHHRQRAATSRSGRRVDLPPQRARRHPLLLDARSSAASATWSRTGSTTSRSPPRWPGEYPGQCAEYCGISHANMRFRVIVHEPADFEKWVASPAGAPGRVHRRARPAGQDALQPVAPAWAATPSPAISAGHIGPDLTHFASRKTFARSLMASDAGQRGEVDREPRPHEARRADAEPRA